MGQKGSKKKDKDKDQNKEEQQQEQQEQQQEEIKEQKNEASVTVPTGESQENLAELPKFNDVPEHFKKRGRRTSVSAESGSGTDEKFVKKVIPKSEDAEQRIKVAVSKSFLFSSLDKDQLKDIINAMEEKKINSGDLVIKQGDNGDYFYVIDSGVFEAWKSMNNEPEKKVFEYNNQGSFGELALMYNCPRAASVKAVSDGIVWAVDRQTFRYIIITATAKQRKLYEQFIQNVPLFSNLTQQERSLIADCLEPLVYQDSEVIIKQGEEAEKFYLIEQGEAKAYQTVEGTGEVEVGCMKTGQYFGERALMVNEPRAATVRACGELKVAAMDRAAFERLLGECRDIMERQIQRYPTAHEVLAKEKEASLVENNDDDK